MVEVSDEMARPIVADEMLRERVKRLSGELDALEKGHAKDLLTFRQVVSVLVGMGDCRGEEEVARALAAVRQAASSDPLQPESLEEAGAALRLALQRETALPVAEPMPACGAGEQVVLALLEGLRLGEPEFDAHLERAMGQIARHMAKGLIRPAMVVLVDLLDHYRQAQARRWTEAEKALREVLGEVLTTQSSLVGGLEASQGSLMQASKDYAQGLTDTMGMMAREIGQAHDLESLKVTALRQIRGLRDQLKAHREREAGILQQAQAQVASLRQALDTTRSRVAMVEERSRALAEQALSDPLTKLLNKRALNQRLEKELAQEGNDKLSLIVFDIDHFKTINDTYGHQAGDRALQAIAHQASMALRTRDTLFRYAGDEFVVVLAGTTSEDALGVAERIRQAAAGIRFTYRGAHEVRITVSLGVAQAKPQDSPESLFERADKALYIAKGSGRDRAVRAN